MMPARYWAIDLGTTNTVVAAWDEAEGGPVILRLEGLMRPPPATAAGRRLDPPAVVPSAVFVQEPQGLADRLGRWRFFEGRCFWGCQGLIGQPALERQQVAESGAARAFAASFKPLLGRNSQQPVAQTGRRAYSVRQVAHIFLRELLAAIHRQAGVRLREAVFTVPVGSFETYREELRRLAQRLGVRRCRTLDEPVAAALGYGLSAEAHRTLLVVDFGGGTLDASYPTRPDFYTYEVTPVCPRGVPQDVFELVICEIGRPHGGHREFFWDARGEMHVIEAGDTGRPVVVKQEKLTRWNGQLADYSQFIARLEKGVADGEAEEQKLTAQIQELLRRGQRGEAREAVLRLEPIRQRLAEERQQLEEARKTYEQLVHRRDAAARRVREQIEITDRQRERAELLEAERRIVQSLADETFEIEAARGLAAAQAAWEQRADRAEAELWVHRDIDTTLEEEEERERCERAEELLAEFEAAPRLQEPVEPGRTLEIEAPGD